MMPASKRSGVHGVAVILATVALSTATLLGVAGYIYLAACGRNIPEALIAVTSGAAGSLAGIVSVVLVVRPEGAGGSSAEININGKKEVEGRGTHP